MMEARCTDVPRRLIEVIRRTGLLYEHHPFEGYRWMKRTNLLWERLLFLECELKPSVWTDARWDFSFVFFFLLRVVVRNSCTI